MKSQLRFSSILLLAAVCLSAQFATAQDAETPVRKLAVCFLNASNTPEIYFKDAAGDYQQLRIDTVRFQSWNTIPANDKLTLHKRVPDPEAESSGEPKFRYEAVQTWSLPEGTDDIRRLLYYQSNGEVGQITFPAGADSHGPMQAKIFNLLDSDVIVRLGGQRQKISSRSDVVLTATSSMDERFIYQFAYQPKDAPSYASPPTKLRFVTPTQRMTIVIGYLPVESESNPGAIRYEAASIRFYEIVPNSVIKRASSPRTTINQTGSAPTTTPPANNYSLVWLAPASANNLQLSYKAGARATPLTVRPNQRVELEAVDSNAPNVQLMLPSGEKLSAQVHRGWENTLIAIAPKNGETSPLTSFESSRQSHPPGSLRLFNLSTYQLAYAVNEEVQYLSPLQATVLRPGQIKESEFTLSLAVKSTEGWVKVSQAPQSFPAPSGREGLFVFESTPGQFLLNSIAL